MNRLVTIGGGIVGLGVVGIGGTLGWAYASVNSSLARNIDAHEVDIPLPFPLSEDEIAALRAERAEAMETPEGEESADPLAGVDLAAVAMERALERGKHLVEARYACVECHGRDFGGGTMVDDPAIGGWFGPNLTPGEGSVTTGFTVADWDRIVRHGIRHDGTPAVMPSEDFMEMSDRELSDVLVYIKSRPAVDRTMPQVTFGPLGAMLNAAGVTQFSCDRAEDHHAAHAVEAPAEAADATYGRHVAQICVGCHRSDLSGGPIEIGPPDWPPAGNLTPHEDGLAGWTFERFDKTMRTGIKADGSEVLEPMSLIPQYAANWTDVEMQAVWAYVQSVPPTPTGE